MRITLSIIGILLILFVEAQPISAYSPGPLDSLAPSDIVNIVLTGLNNNRNSFEGTDRKVKEFAWEVYRNQFDRMEKDFRSGRFMFSSSITHFLQKTLDAIKAANQTIPSELTVVAIRDNTPNAINFGNGLLGINIGLLSKLENLEQLNYVLCHEVAHSLAGHSRKMVTEAALINSDRDLNNRLNKAKGNTYNRYTNMRRVLLEAQFRSSSYSKVMEFEADSIGLQLYLKLAMNPRQSIRCLEVLDSIDLDFSDAAIDFRSIFDSEEYPFKDSWLTYTKSQTWHRSAKSIYPDSLRTHPNCKERIEAIERQLKSVNIEYPHTTEMSEVVDKAKLEQVETSFNNKEYGKSLYYSLVLINDLPDNIYLQALIGRSLYFLFKSQEQHELGKVLELPDPRFSESYDRFLSFVHKLRHSELEAICYNYVAAKPSAYFENEEFAYTLWLCSNLKISRLDPALIASDYYNKFPNGKHLKELKHLTN